MSSDRSDDNKNLPPWLRDVPLPPRPRDQAAAAPARPDPSTATPEPQAPSWANGTSPATPAPGDQHGLPDWLRDSQPESSPPASSAEQLPSWLRDIAGPIEPSAPAEASAPSETSSAAALPDWLRDSGPETPPAGAEQLPDWLRDIAGETPGPAAPASVSDQSSWRPPDQPAAAAAGDVPDWLRDQAFDADTSAAQPPALDDLFAEPGLPAQPPERAAPHSRQDTTDDRAAAPKEPPATPNEPALPDWLRDISADTEDIDSRLEPFSFESPGDTEAGRQAGELPAWLGADAADDSGATVPDWLASSSQQSPPSNAEPEQAAPSWLTEADSSTGQPGETPGRPDTDVPLWLQDIDSGAEPSAPADKPPPAAAPTAQPADEQAPSWLQDTAANAPAPAEADNLPSWLQDTAASTPAPAEAESLPSWLQDAAPSAPAPAEAESLPSWLQDAAPSAPAPAEAESLPSWLQDAAPSAPAQEPEQVPAWLRDSAPPAEPAPSENVPAWLQDAAPPTAENVPAEAPDIAPIDQGTGRDAASPAEPAEADSLPDWLRPASKPPTPAPGADQDIPPWLRDEAGQPLPTAGAPGDTNLPAWLRGATIERTPTPPAGQPPAPQTGAPSLDWFADEPATAAPQEAAGGPGDELVGGIELPAWLRPPEPEQPKEINRTDARSLDWLTRLGSQEEEEAASLAATPALKLRPPAAPERSPAQVEAIALLQRLATDLYPAAEPMPEPATPSLWRRFGFERLLYLLLLLALIAGLALPISGSLGLNRPPAAPGAQDLFGQLDKLSASDTVLVGYEWDARRSGELRPLEQAVLGHLIQRKVKLVLVSTDPQGTLLQFDLRDRLGEAGYKPSGEDYILLGYKPGAELALRSLARDVRGALRSDFQGNDASRSGLATDASGQPRLNSLGDFAMVLVLADEPGDVQGWMEQVHPSAARSDGSPVPFGFLLPAETTPIVQPYLSQPGVYHLAGKQGALAYQQLRGDSGFTPDQLAGQAGQQRLSLLVYVALFALGAVGIGISSAATWGRKRG